MLSCPALIVNRALASLVNVRTDTTIGELAPISAAAAQSPCLSSSGIITSAYRTIKHSNRSTQSCPLWMSRLTGPERHARRQIRTSNVFTFNLWSPLSSSLRRALLKRSIPFRNRAQFLVHLSKAETWPDQQVGCWLDWLVNLPRKCDRFGTFFHVFTVRFLEIGQDFLLNFEVRCFPFICARWSLSKKMQENTARRIGYRTFGGWGQPQIQYDRVSSSEGPPVARHRGGRSLHFKSDVNSRRRRRLTDVFVCFSDFFL